MTQTSGQGTSASHHNTQAADSSQKTGYGTSIGYEGGLRQEFSGFVC